MEDKYKEKRSEYWRAHKQKQLKLKWGIIDPNLKDFFETRVSIDLPPLRNDVPIWTAKDERVKWLKGLADAAQKQVRKEWAHRGNVNNIIIIELGNVRKDKANFNCEVHQLKMTKEKTAEYAVICEQVIKSLAQTPD